MSALDLSHASRLSRRQRLRSAAANRAATADFPHLSRRSRGEASSRGFRSGRSSRARSRARSRTLRGSNLQLGIRSSNALSRVNILPADSTETRPPFVRDRDMRLRPLPSPPAPIASPGAFVAFNSEPASAHALAAKAADAALGELHKADRRAGNPNATSDASSERRDRRATRRCNVRAIRAREHSNRRVTVPRRARDDRLRARSRSRAAGTPCSSTTPTTPTSLGARNAAAFPNPGATKKTNSRPRASHHRAEDAPRSIPVAAARRVARAGIALRRRRPSRGARPVPGPLDVPGLLPA